MHKRNNNMKVAASTSAHSDMASPTDAFENLFKAHAGKYQSKWKNRDAND
jgi:hypothetical protein